MESRGLDAAGLQPARDPIRSVLHARKHQHHGEAWVAHKMHEERGFEVLRHFINELRHRFGGVGTAANLDGARRV